MTHVARTLLGAAIGGVIGLADSPGHALMLTERGCTRYERFCTKRNHVYLGSMAQSYAAGDLWKATWICLPRYHRERQGVRDHVIGLTHHMNAYTCSRPQRTAPSCDARLSVHCRVHEAAAGTDLLPRHGVCLAWRPPASHQDALHETRADSRDGRVALFSKRASASTTPLLNAIHRDLKPANVLIDDHNIDAADLGIANILRGGIRSHADRNAPVHVPRDPSPRAVRRQTTWALGHPLRTSTCVRPSTPRASTFSATTSSRVSSSSGTSTSRPNSTTW